MDLGEEVIKRFWEKVDKRGDDECWNWLASLDPFGYGWFWDPQRKKMGRPHRFSFVLHGGDLPEKQLGERGAVGTLVRHTCNNPSCVNPSHLISGSQKDNMQDMIVAGRNPNYKGELNPRTILSREQALQVLEIYTGSYGEQSFLARLFGVTPSCIGNIVNGGRSDVYEEWSKKNYSNIFIGRYRIKVCIVDGCENRGKIVKGMCSKHYGEQRNSLKRNDI